MIRNIFKILPLVTLSSALFPQAAEYPASKHGGNYMFNYYFPPAPGTTPWAPAWAPDGKSIAVAMQGSIWRVDPATGSATELTYNRRYHSSPAWSPDGKWIVYTADDNGKSIQLEILNIETGETHALTADQHIYTDPTFSPDGQRLCYVSTRPNGYFNIYVRPIRDGQWAGDETALTRDHRYPRDRLYFGFWDMHIEPAWTRDGKAIVFVSNHGVPLGSGDLWRTAVAPAAGDDPMTNAHTILREQTLYRTRPDVSIDGKRIVYSSTAGAADQYAHLYVVPIDGGAPYKLTFGSHDDFHPRWSPDGEWIAYISNEGGLPQLCLLETYGGTKKKVLIRERHRKRPMGRIHVRVVDENTGRAAPVRIQYLASDGKFYAPADAYARIGLADRHLFHTDGEFTAEVPPGKMAITAIKGFAWRPGEKQVEVAADRTVDLTLALRRVVDMNALGWYSGSTHVHMNYGGNLSNTLDNLRMMSRAEDQNVLNVLVANKDNRIFDWQHFVPGGGEHPVSRNDAHLKVIVGEEYRPPFYGHVFFLGLKDHLISPFTTGYEGTAIESLYPSNTDMFRKASAQGAVTGYVHAFSGDADPLESTLGVAKAFPVDAALGTVQAVEWSHPSRAQLRVWHHALNNDLAITPTGGEDSINNLHHTNLIGSVRTYVHLNGPLTAEAWLNGLRQGHTFFSTGPLMDLRINGRLPGDTIRLPATGGSLSVEGTVWSIAPLSKVVLYSNGQVVKEFPTSGHFTEQIRVSQSGWYSLYAEGAASEYLDAVYAQAATNAIRVYVGDRPIRNRDSAAYFIRWIDKLHQMAGEWPGWRSEAEKHHVFAQFDEARGIYEKFAREAK
ncbi:MAG: translocation protein TolB [Bryobacterales bacterium]|nr:translocation protein TolB [Bryobacterales bacterium]